MTESVGRGRRARRSTEVSQRLARARERNNRQLVEIRERERQVEQALRDYVSATEEITAAERACDERVAQLEDRIRQVRAERDSVIGDVRVAQARAVLAVHTAGRTVKQVAELLELSEKAARQLIGCGRDQRPDPRRPASVPASAAMAETGTPDYREPAREYWPGPVREARQ